MIKFFRNIRQNLLSEGKTSKYLKYAIGEIVLVVIGILIALQLNTWNAQRIQENEIRATYERVLEEINSTREQVLQKTTMFDSILIARNKQSLRLIQLKDKDSIHKIYESIRALSNVVIVSYDMPSTSEFLNNENISNVKNTTLKTLFLNLKRSLQFGTVVDDYANTQLNTIIEPYIIKNLNYAQMIRGTDMVAINTLSDSSFFFDNLELENLLNLKIETDNTKKSYLKTFEAILKRTAEEINTELNKK